MIGNHPPRLLLKFFKWFCHPELHSFIEGDLLELYQERLIEQGRNRANWLLTLDILFLLRPGIIKSIHLSTSQITYDMFRHHILLSLRGFKKDKTSSIINLLGLSSGLTCVILILLWVQDEVSIDKGFANDHYLFQVLQNTRSKTGIETIEATPSLLAPSLSAEIPEISHAVSVIPPTFNMCKGIISTREKIVKVRAQYVSSGFFDVFPYPFVQGDRTQVLLQKNEVVISQTLAMKLYGDDLNVLGRTFEWQSQTNNGLFMVVGVFDTPERMSSPPADIMLSFALYENMEPDQGWSNNVPRTYIRSQQGITAQQLNKKIRDFLKSKTGDQESTLFAQRFSDRYLYGKFENGKPAGGRIQYVRLFFLTSLLILIISAVNFVNLSTARSLKRIKEIGVKKAIGAPRRSLIVQFLAEPILLSFLSLVIATLVCYLFMDQFNRLTGKDLSIVLTSKTIAILLVIGFSTGIIAGAYPAGIMSRLRPNIALKGLMLNPIHGALFRQRLVIFQFVTSILLVCSVVVVYKQVRFIQEKNLGFDRDQVIHFDVPKMNVALLSEMNNVPEVLNAGGGDLITGAKLGGTSGIEWKGKNTENPIFFSVKWVGPNLVETIGLTIVAGKSFGQEINAINKVLVNETAINMMGISDPIGQTITINQDQCQIVGIVKDFNFESLYEKVKPCVIRCAPIEYAPSMSVKIRSGMESTAIEKLQKIYVSHFPGQVFDYRYMDEDYQQLYASETLIEALAKYFAGLAIIISCLGLFGLSLFSIQQRIKETCIRKVLGATTIQLISVLSGSFVKLILIALVISLPLSYWISYNWLTTFEYHVMVEWWYFGLAALFIVVLMFISIGWQTIKATRVNPAEILRNE